MELFNQLSGLVKYGPDGIVPAYGGWHPVLVRLSIQIDIRRERRRGFGTRINGYGPEASPLDALLKEKMFFAFGVKGPYNGYGGVLVNVFLRVLY